MCLHVLKKFFLFLSTPSVRRATALTKRIRRICDISIHALREEGDPAPVAAADADRQISIHALREEGDIGATTTSCQIRISIHALREEGDLLGITFGGEGAISIHALREEGDILLMVPPSYFGDFYPRPP